MPEPTSSTPVEPQQGSTEVDYADPVVIRRLMSGYQGTCIPFNRTTIGALCDKIERLTRDLEAAQRKADACIGDCQNRLTDALDHSTGLRAELEAARQQIEQLREEKENQFHTACDRKLEAAQTKLVDERAVLEITRGWYQVCKRDRDTLKAEVDAARQQNATLELLLHNNQVRAEEVERLCGDRGRELKEARARLAAAQEAADEALDWWVENNMRISTSISAPWVPKLRAAFFDSSDAATVGQTPP